MVSRVRTLMNLLVITALCLSQPVYPGIQKDDSSEKGGEASPRVLCNRLLTSPQETCYYGPGGRGSQPRGKFKFIEEDLSGTKPKFQDEDVQGVRWKVKLAKKLSLRLPRRGCYGRWGTLLMKIIIYTSCGFRE